MDTQKPKGILGKRSVSMRKKQERYDSDFRRKAIGAVGSSREDGHARVYRVTRCSRVAWISDPGLLSLNVQHSYRQPGLIEKQPCSRYPWADEPSAVDSEVESPPIEA